MRWPPKGSSGLPQDAGHSSERRPTMAAGLTLRCARPANSPVDQRAATSGSLPCPSTCGHPGSQRAIGVFARTVVGPGDYVLVESPTFITALDILEGRGATLLSVPLEAEGRRVDQIASLTERYRPRLMYAIPPGHSRTAVTMA